MTNCIKIVAKDILSEPRGGSPPYNDTLKQNEEVKISTKINQYFYKNLKNNYG